MAKKNKKKNSVSVKKQQLWANVTSVFACPHSPSTKHCLSTNMSLVACWASAFQQLCPFLPIFPSSLLSSLLPSFHSLTPAHSLTLNLPTLSLRRREVDRSFAPAGGYPDAVSMATGAAVKAVCNRTL